MAENYSFFNSKDHDRVYNASHWADYFFPLFKSGVFNGDLQVVANGGMTVRINAGYAWIDGYAYHLDAPLVLDIETASGNMNRKDNIVIRLDLTNRWVRSFAVTGTYYSGEATPPAPDISATLHELVIARVNVAAGTTEITQDMIEDTRMDGDLCGWVCGAVDQIDFSQIKAQFDSYFEKFKAEIAYERGIQEEDFADWFERMKDQLSEDAAGNLQMQINELSIDLNGQKESVQRIVTDTFSVDVDYVAGDYCIFNDTLYQFTKEKNAGEWDPEAVQATTIAEQLSELNSNLLYQWTGCIALRYGEHKVDQIAHTAIIMKF